MNDTLAVIGMPLVLRLAREHGLSGKLFLLTLAYAITLGSVMSPIGNPQNLLIATAGLAAPFQTFFEALAAGSTIAGNFLILGDASNVIIIQHAEKHGATLIFWLSRNCRGRHYM